MAVSQDPASRAAAMLGWMSDRLSTVMVTAMVLESVQ